LTFGLAGWLAVWVRYRRPIPPRSTRMSAPRIHPTAVIHPEAKLAEDVRVGPFAVIDAGVTLGHGCTVGPHAYLTGLLTAGANNQFHAHCVIGDAPQHTGYAGEPTGVQIGDGNTFREFVTVHRGMPANGGVTRIGDGNMFMATSHVAHDCTVGSKCIFANGAVIGGHAAIGDGAFLSGNVCVHQFCRVGRLVMLAGGSVVNQDVPPFWLVQGPNTSRGVNVVGMRRAGLSNEAIMGVRRAYKAINLSGHAIRDSLGHVETADGHLPVVREVIEFVRASKRGIVTARGGGDDA
jgi:UDP-N-acetylglucosamine acyltransferase